MKKQICLIILCNLLLFSLTNCSNTDDYDAFAFWNIEKFIENDQDMSNSAKSLFYEFGNLTDENEIIWYDFPGFRADANVAIRIKLLKDKVNRNINVTRANNNIFKEIILYESDPFSGSIIWGTSVFYFANAKIDGKIQDNFYMGTLILGNGKIDIKLIDNNEKEIISIYGSIFEANFLKPIANRLRSAKSNHQGAFMFLEIFFVVLAFATLFLGFYWRKNYTKKSEDGTSKGKMELPSHIKVILVFLVSLFLISVIYNLLMMMSYL